MTEVKIGPGLSTGQPEIVKYRLDKLTRSLKIRGDWLDCGGFDGHYAVGLLKRGASTVTLTDIDATRVDVARRRWGEEPRMRFSACPAENMPFEDACFDGVLLNEVFEHVVDERQTLAEIRRVLRPGGVLALFSPNRWFPLEGHGLRVGQRRIHAPAPLIPWLPKRLTKPYVKARNYWPRELLAHVRAAGLRPRRPQFVFPMMVNYPWMPARLIGPYQRNVTKLDRLPILNRLGGVSTLVIAERPA